VKLYSLYKDALQAFKPQLKKHEDPNLPELDGQPTDQREYGAPPMPSRSGVQDTPLKPRHRKYFNAKTNQPATDKVGYPDQAWSNIKSFTPSMPWLRPYRPFSNH
jgi:hypothetical protein